jgi:RNA polymerase sigma-70 factor (ECF subfamily)
MRYQTRRSRVVGIDKKSLMPQGGLDESAIRDFMAADYARLVAALSLLGEGGQSAAEDAVQEALARAWERSQRGEVISSLPAWVTVVAMNLQRSRVRRLAVELRTRAALLERSDRAEPDVSDDRIDLERALRRVPRRQRLALVLRYGLDLPVREVALGLGISEDAAKALVHRARRSIATSLGAGERADG